MNSTHKQFGWLFLVLFYVNVIVAQDYIHFDPIKSSGQLPADFTVKSSTKYERAVKQISHKDKKSKQKLQRNFYLESSFSVDNLVRSGVVVFSPEISDYFTNVAKAVLGKDDPLLEKARFYLLRSTAVNAFATTDGSIFICMGLLAQLENEAQLGFILSHELIHVKEKHALDMLIKVDDIRKGVSSEKVMSTNRYNHLLLEKSKYSKKIELEADSKGFDDYFSKSGYDVNAIDRTYDVLLYSYLPFDEEKFDYSFLEDEHYKFPKSYQLDTIKRIGAVSDTKNDSLSTHPSISTRRDNIKKLIASKKLEGGKEYIVSESKFQKLQKDMRFELPMLHLHESEFQDAIYTSYLLLRQEPNSVYLKKCIAKALFGLAKFSNDTDEYVPAEDIDPKKIEGEQQTVFHLVNKMSKQERTVLALRYIWNLHKENPKDEELTAMAQWIADDIVAYHNPMSYFSAKTPSEKAASPIITKKEEPKEDETPKPKKKKTKYDKIAEKKEKEEQEMPKITTDSVSYTQFAFIEALRDSSFKKLFTKAEENKEKEEKWRSVGNQKRVREEYNKAQKKGNRMGLDKIVIVNPFYLSIDARKENAIQYIESEQKLDEFTASLQENAKLAGLETQILSTNKMKANDTETFNDMTIMNEWVSEQIDYGRMTYSGYKADEVARIAKKYNTRYFMWTGLVSLHKKKSPLVYIAGIASFIVVYPIPFAIYFMAKPQYESLYYAVVYDTETQRSKVVKYVFMRRNDTNVVRDMHLYDTFLQIKSKPKK